MNIQRCMSTWYHATAQIDSLKVNTSVIGTGLINITGPITSATEVTASVLHDH